LLLRAAVVDNAGMSNENVTQLLDELDSPGAAAGAREKLLPLVYDELRRLAANKMKDEAADHTLQPTALVHEAYLRLVGPANRQRWESRGHFYAAAAEAMRRILIEEARRRQSLKRGGDFAKVELAEGISDVEPAVDYAELLAVSEALDKLFAVDPEAARLVKLRYFAGLTIEEAAEAMGVSPRTAKRNWSYARAWLQRELSSH
jgi:RNA polymerase sigma factor (TIGR02999 family)